jgi:glycosyltransferase involved in cell wall biosynthesis
VKIAVNTRFLLDQYLEGYGYFLQEVLQRLVQARSQDEFIFIFDRPFDQKFIYGKNVKGIVAGPPARHPLLWKYWYDVKVPAILKSEKADVFLSCDGFCSLRTKVPQVLVIHDLAFLHFPNYINKTQLLFYKHYTPRFLRKATSVVTVSHFSRKDILNHYPIASEKISVVHNAARDSFQPLDYEAQQAVREKYTEGKNYFIYAGAIHPRKNLTNLLKAFSIFKKRQKSDWKLVLAGRMAWKNEAFLKSLTLYKHRNDVVVTGYVAETELAQLVGSAYALVYPSVWEGFGVPVIEAMQSGIPVITSLGSAMQEIAGTAALYADPLKHDEMAAQMMLIYKDENLRSSLIEEGSKVAKQYSWEMTAQQLWEKIENAALIRRKKA